MGEGEATRTRALPAVLLQGPQFLWFPHLFLGGDTLPGTVIVIEVEDTATCPCETSSVIGGVWDKMKRRGFWEQVSTVFRMRWQSGNP